MRTLLPAAILLTASLLGGCSLPRVVVLHDPLSADEHVRLGSIYASEGKRTLARDQFREAARLDKAHRAAWALLGEQLFLLEEYDEAETAYDRALELDPDSGDLQNNLAWVYVQQGRKLGRAIELVDRAMEVTPAHQGYYLDTRGVILLRQGKAAEAAEALKRSVALIPPEQPLMLAEAYGHLAEALREAGDEAGADEARAHRRRLLQEAADKAPPR